mmetsp:Transcript_37137/g.66714  ORF Transcript_37137/g.66714 Transcript_37137/m.66714 type:complete len:254 (+) Transcript_37137:90-851(+)
MHPSQNDVWPVGWQAPGQVQGPSTFCDVPAVVLVKHFGPVLNFKELFNFCAAHSSFWSNSTAFLGWLAASQHGTDTNTVATFRQLRELERTPRLYELEFTSPKFLVESGVCLTSKLQRGTYRVSITGLQNPNFGTLDLWLDDVCVTDRAKLDCNSHDAAEQHTFPALEVEIWETGKHVWRFETTYHRGLSQDDSMRLKEFRVECVCPAKPRRRKAFAWLQAVAHQAANAMCPSIPALMSGVRACTKALRAAWL